MMSTPSRSSHFRAQNNSSSYSPTVTSGGIGQQKLNVITRVAIEGKAKQGQDGASIRMFLKVPSSQMYVCVIAGLISFC